MSDNIHSYILKITCPDKMGIVAEVASYLRDRGCFIEESSHFGDRDTAQFFMRTRFTPDNSGFSRATFSSDFADIAERFSMQWELHDTAVLPRVLIMVSRFDHCLNDLLYRYRTGALRMSIPGIISNHMALANLAEWHKIPFFHVPVTEQTRADAEQRLLEIVEETKAELIVLARYMQILSDEVCEKLTGQVINIHHSFLPGFKGGRPYQQAHERGVKLIGATAHYVTCNLDEGPIIEQMVERVDHTQTVEDLVAVGRDVEAITLARAVKFHVEQRVFLNDRKTVVFR